MAPLRFLNGPDVAGRRSANRAGRSIRISSVQQIELHPGHVGAVILNVDMHTGLSGPLERSRRFSGCRRKPDDPIISLEDDPFAGGAKPSDARSHLTTVGTSISLTDGGVQHTGAVDRQARGGILCRSRTHATAACCRAFIF
jgi:hypothetical protein